MERVEGEGEAPPGTSAKLKQTCYWKFRQEEELYMAVWKTTMRVFMVSLFFLVSIGGV
jgi:hypothetical protein